MLALSVVTGAARAANAITVEAASASLPQATDSVTTGNEATSSLPSVSTEIPRITNRNTDTAGAQADGRVRSPAGHNASRPSSAPFSSGPSEFQKFVQESTGKLLPIFGSDFFANANVFSNPAAPVTNDYTLGPGDEVLIRGWGSINLDVRAVIDRNGLISIPKVGTVPLAGVRAGDAEGVLHAAIGKIYRDFNLSVTLGQLRGITIYVVGQALRPGTYNVSSTSTLVTALFESGGPNPYGSMRHVEVKRDGKVVANMDLYAFLAKGDKSADIHLADGDVVVIPPAYGHVALTGEVKTPAIYELRDNNETLSAMLDMAGGMPLLADPRRAFLEHVKAGRDHPRSVEEFALDAHGLSHLLQPGDLVAILPITPAFDNAVTLRGLIRLPYRPGMRVTDLIPNREFLVSRQIAQSKNQAALAAPGTPGLGQSAVGQFAKDINWDYAVVERIQRPKMTTELVPFNLGRALDDPASPDNLPLQPGDTVSVFSADDVQVPAAKRQVFVRIEGEVKQPGVYQVVPGETLVNVLEKAGGPTPDAYLFGSEFFRDSVRRSQQANLDRFIQRLQQQMLSQSNKTAANMSVNDPTVAQSQQALAAAQLDAQNRFLQRLQRLKSTGRVSLGLPAQGASIAQLPEMRLENGDRLIIPPRPDFVQVFGSVNTESALLWRSGSTVSDYLKMAGTSREADTDATFVLRADGTVVADNGSWFTSVASTTVLPGDIIVVPEKLDLQTGWTAFMSGAKDWTTILFNFGLGAAAIKTLQGP
ncbi:MAG: SLBB domain-containing protein [Betaproteobacteria bacterium]|nr:SLBB domain-containing protein [Betaproteobacteria bacterium]